MVVGKLVLIPLLLWLVNYLLGHFHPSSESQSLAQDQIFLSDNEIQMPSQCSFVDFNEWGDELNSLAAFIRNALQPDSMSYPYIRAKVDPLELDIPFDEMLRAKLPGLGVYQANLEIHRAKVYNFVPTEITLIPAEGFDQQLSITVRLPKVQLEYYYKAAFEYGKEPKHKDAMLHLSARVEKAVLHYRVKIECVECEGRHKLAKFVFQVGQGFATGGIEGMQKAAMLSVYDADLEDVSISFDNVNIQNIRITDFPQGDQVLDQMEPRLTRVANKLKGAANFLCNGIMKERVQKQIARRMIKNTRRKVDKARSYFYKPKAEPVLSKCK